MSESGRHGPELPDGLVEESHDLLHGMAGTDSIIPSTSPGVDDMTLGTVILNRSDEDVHIESFEIAESAGPTVTPELVIRTPRRIDLVAGEGRWPPTPQWEPEAQHPFAPFDPPAGADSARWGAMILMHVDFEARFGYVKGYWIRGTQGGEEFEDFSDTFTGFCVGTDTSEAECYEFINQHSFTEQHPIGATTGLPP